MVHVLNTVRYAHPKPSNFALPGFEPVSQMTIYKAWVREKKMTDDLFLRFGFAKPYDIDRKPARALLR